MRRAFTLTEVLIAATVLSVLLVGLLQMFTITQRQAVTAESLMSYGVLAQIVSERVKANVESNPRYLADLTGGTLPWAGAGTVVDPASATAGTLRLSPFFEHLLTRQAPDLYDPANKVAIASATSATATGYQPNELGALITTFRDYEIQVVIENDVSLDATAPAAYAEIVKVVRVTVARSSVVKAQGSDPLQFTLTTRVVTPADALTSGALAAIYQNFEGPPLEDLWTDTFMAAANNPFIQAPQLGIESRRVLADAFMVLAGANTEDLVVQGEYVPGSQLIEVVPGAQFIDPWIVQLSAPDSIGFSTAKGEIASLQRRKATTIFDTFKKIRLPLEHLCASVLGPAPVGIPLIDRVRELKTRLETDLTAAVEFQTKMAQAIVDYDKTAAQIAALSTTTSTTSTAGTTTSTTSTASTGATTGTTSTGSSGTTTSAAASGTTTDAALLELERKQAEQLAAMQAMQAAYDQLMAQAQQAADADTETVVLSTFLQQFFTDANYAPVATRPARYPERFRQTLDELAATQARHLDMTNGVTAWERMRAAQGFFETTVVRQIERGATDGVALSRINGLASSFAQREGELAAYLRGSEVADLAKLKARNQLFADRCDDLHRLGPQFAQVIALLQPGGEIAQFLALYASMFGQNSKLDASKLLGDIQNVIDGSSRKKRRR